MNSVIVIPTYNERENIGTLIDKLQTHAGDSHVLVVDDNSPDGTGRVAEGLRLENPERIFVLHRERKDGLGRAYVHGFRWALAHGYRTIVQMDADLSHDPSYLPRFFEAIRDCDLVLGSRYLHGISVVNWDLKRLMLSQLATLYVKRITGMPFTDATSGFKCWRDETLRSIKIDDAFANGYLFQIETTYRAYRRGFRVREIPIIFFERDRGRSKFDIGIIVEAIFGVLRLRLRR
jgi:dolichol-phosphate mannosyltransferase